MMTEAIATHPATMSIDYKFSLNDGAVKEFHLELYRDTLRLAQKERDSWPAWTELSFFKCPNCPLSVDQHPRCPIAENLVDVIDFFRNSVSFEEADAEIVTEARTCKKRTELQSAISSLMGIYMVTSGCPIMDKLRPMVFTHLPFATGPETMYRAMSMYLLAQYFLNKRGVRPDWDMKNLVKIYEEIRTVNRSFCHRLSAAEIQDASLNAVVHLDCFADMTSFSLDHKNLGEIESLFESYLKGGCP